MADHRIQITDRPMSPTGLGLVLIFAPLAAWIAAHLGAFQ